jgi:glycosyltransferase involved in cell wall biosynthesis
VVTGKPLVLNLHDPWGSSHHNWFEYNLGMCLEGFCCNRAKAIVTASKTIPRTLKERHGVPESKCYVAPNAVDVERFDVSKAEIEAARRKYGIPNKKIILFVGSVSKWNGVHHLIGAAGLVKSKDVQFVIVGGGRDEEFMKELAKKHKNIMFTGVVPYEEVPALIRLADVCAAPFPRVESVGWKDYEAPVPHLLLEYMGAGKPIVGSDVHVVGELLSDGRGLPVRPEDSKAIASGLDELLGDSKKAAAMGKKARDYAKKDLNWMGSTEVVERALQDAIGLKGRKS